MSDSVVKGSHGDRRRVLNELAAVFGEHRTPRSDRIMAQRFWAADDRREALGRSTRPVPEVARVIPLGDRAGGAPASSG